MVIGGHFGVPVISFLYVYFVFICICICFYVFMFLFYFFKGRSASQGHQTLRDDGNPAVFL